MTQKKSDLLDLSKDEEDESSSSEAYEAAKKNPSGHDCERNFVSITEARIVKTDAETGETVPVSPPEVITWSNQQTFPFSHQFISTQLTLDRWEEILRNPGNPAFIDSQTGSGKSTVLLNEVASIVNGWGQKLLILVSRSVLKQQIKYEAADIWCPELRKDLTDSGISKEHHFGAVDIYSYQDFINPNCRNDIRWELRNRHYGAVAFDECHYFISDADFNQCTEMQFDFLLESFIRAGIPRIYLTATPEYVFDCIYDKEMQESEYLSHLPLARSSAPQQKILKRYQYERDYSYLQIRFFKEERLLELLIDHVQGGNKILFFTETKEYAEDLIQKLDDRGIHSTFLLHADSKNQEKNKNRSESQNKKEIDFETVHEAMLKNNETGVDILFATKCLDAGTTINTKDLVIFCLFQDRVDFIQAIGRKRLTSSNEKVYLYIPAYTDNDAKDREEALKARKKELIDATEKFPEGARVNGCEPMPVPVYAENGRYKHNSFSMRKIDEQLRDIRWLREKIAESTTDPEIIIAKHIIAWLDLEDTFSTDMIMDYHPDKDPLTDRENIHNIILSYEGWDLSEEDFEKIKDLLSPYDNRADKRPGREMSTQTINSIFKSHDLSFKISIIPGKKADDSQNRKYKIEPLTKGGDR